MQTTREIPSISDRELGILARKIKPVISLNALPLGRYPQDDVITRFLKVPKDLRGMNFLQGKAVGRPVLFTEVTTLRTLHTPGSAGRVFHPTIAEVMAQIPEDWQEQTIAFETFLSNHDPEYEGSLHLATTVLLQLASPRTGEFQRFHYS